MILKFKKKIKDLIVKIVSANPHIESGDLITKVLKDVRKFEPMEDADVQRYREAVTQLSKNYLDAIRETEDDSTE
ncbi:MAG: hypothetical protein JNK14_08730 [Chitinophagaceae bacterium]|nr:hypothetical protein [Chitinophagaceae bacterium]